MTTDTPWALPVRIDEDRPAVNLAPPAEGAGAVVALVASEGPRGSGWSARVAASLAREWAGDGLRVFLADGDFERPVLHGEFGVENGEGVSDAVLYGASPGRVGRAVPEGGFLFAPAGTVVADPGSVYSHPRWSALLEAFRESGSVLLLYLPDGQDPGVEGLVERADRVIRFTDRAPDRDPGRGHLYIHPAGEAAGAVPTTDAIEDAATEVRAAEAAIEGSPAESEAEEDAPFLGGEPEADFDLDDPVGVAGAELPDADAVEPGTTETDAEEASSDFSLSEDFLADDLGGGLELEDVEGEGPEGPQEEEFAWDGSGELSVTDEWAGEGPSSIGAGTPGAGDPTGDPSPPDLEDEDEPTVPAESADEEAPVTHEPPPQGATVAGFESMPEPGRAETAPSAGGPPVAGGPGRGGGQRPSPPAREPAAVGSGAPRPPVRARPVERSRGPRLVLLLLLLVAAVLVAAWFGYVTIPGLDFGAAPGAGGGDSSLLLPVLPSSSG